MYRLLLIGLICFPTTAAAVNLPSGFIDRRIASDVTGATAMAFAPDGRLFVCQQSGQLRIIKNGLLLDEPFVTVETDNTGERGLLGIAFDPDFASNGFVYVYYTALVSPRHNRVSRFTADGDHAIPESEQLILQLDDLSAATIHNGGAMHFGNDGKLYIAVGENGTPQNSQALTNVFGKMLRINKDGSIPDDNPFAAITTGAARSIWALGLRNPFTFDVDPGTGRIFINDVGEATAEEINDGIIGSNYGWPLSEGSTDDESETGPLFSYGHGIGPESGCAITGGTFYRPGSTQFPASFVGKYFFADFCSGWIRVFDPTNFTVAPFADGLSLPVDLKVAQDGSLYYLARGSDSVNQIVFTGTSAPFITSQPASLNVSVGDEAVFTVEATGDQPLAFQWQRNAADIAGANSATLTIPTVSLSDSGAQFRVVVSNQSGSVTSDAATLTVTDNQPPVVTITSPVEHSLYTAGDTIEYSGTANDPEDGELPPSAFTWQVDFHHDTHSHPFIPPTSGAASGSFVIPVIGEKSANVWYRIRLKVTDSDGRTSESFRDILPHVSVVTLATEPAGLQVLLDGQPDVAPTSFTGVAGIVRNISTAPLQTLNGQTFQFTSWSDNGEIGHDISTPASNQTLTARFTLVTPPESVIQFQSAHYEVSESDPFLEVTVMRTGDLSTPQSVKYATTNDTATERDDYLPVFGTLFFQPNESEQKLKILITDSATVEDTEHFNVVLFDTSGDAALGNPSVADILLRDDDNQPPTSNPIDDARYFVRQHYQDFLNREPDPSGEGFWINQITECGTDPQCLDIKRQNVSAAFFFSIEFQETGFLVYRLHRAAFNSFPHFAETLGDTQELGRRVVVGFGDWEAQLETNKAQFLNRFIERTDFLENFPASLTPAEFIDKLNQNTAFSLSPDERNALISRLASGSITRAEALRSVVEDDDFKAREFNRAFVLFQYFGYLRRNPDDTPDSGFDGYEFWLNKLNQFNGNFERAEMVRAFLSALEYRHRFGP